MQHDEPAVGVLHLGLHSELGLHGGGGEPDAALAQLLRPRVDVLVLEREGDALFGVQRQRVGVGTVVDGEPRGTGVELDPAVVLARDAQPEHLAVEVERGREPLGVDDRVREPRPVALGLALVRLDELDAVAFRIAQRRDAAGRRVLDPALERHALRLQRFDARIERNHGDRELQLGTGALRCRTQRQRGAAKRERDPLGRAVGDPKAQFLLVERLLAFELGREQDDAVQAAHGARAILPRSGPIRGSARHSSTACTRSGTRRRGRARSRCPCSRRKACPDRRSCTC